MTLTPFTFLFSRGCVQTAKEIDLKSIEGNLLGVRLPPSLLMDLLNMQIIPSYTDNPIEDIVNAVREHFSSVDRTAIPDTFVLSIKAPEDKVFTEEEHTTLRKQIDDVLYDTPTIWIVKSIFDEEGYIRCVLDIGGVLAR